MHQALERIQISSMSEWREFLGVKKEDLSDEVIARMTNLPMDVADTEQILRLIQSIPSPKAEPFLNEPLEVLICLLPCKSSSWCCYF